MMMLVKVIHEEGSRPEDNNTRQQQDIYTHFTSPLPAKLTLHTPSLSSHLPRALSNLSSTIRIIA